MTRSMIAIVVAALLSLSSRAFADDDASFALVHQTLVINVSGQTMMVVPLGCKGRGFVRAHDRVVVACGKNGVVVVDVSDVMNAHVVDRRTTTALEVYFLDDQVWVRSEGRGLHPLDASTPPPPVVPQPDVASPSPLPSRNLPERRGGVLDLSTTELAFVSFKSGPCSGSNWFCLNPIANGGGALFSMSATYHFNAPAFIAASVDTGFGADDATPAAIGVFTGYVVGGLDTRFFEAGVGAGGNTLGDGGGGFTLVAHARLGATDGLNLHVMFGFTPNRFGEIETSWAVGARFPLATRVALEVDAQNTAATSVQFLAGARVRVAGNNGHNTVGITPSLGFASVAGTQINPTNQNPIEVTIAGLAIAFGVDWRL